MFLNLNIAVCIVLIGDGCCSPSLFLFANIQMCAWYCTIFHKNAILLKKLCKMFAQKQTMYYLCIGFKNNIINNQI